MQVREIQSKTILSKSGLGVDWAINPYVGCSHGCKYCYAQYMNKFSNHGQRWGSYLDVKVNAPQLIPQRPGKFYGQKILFSSVTDAYQPIEKTRQLTRKILKRLVVTQPRLTIITKSDLVLRDAALLRQFQECTVACSVSLMTESTRRELEPGAPGIEKRLQALRKLSAMGGIKTVLFISPIFPYICDWQGFITRTRGYVSEYWFENINLYNYLKTDLRLFYRNCHPELLDRFVAVFKPGNNYWTQLESQIHQHCRRHGIPHQIFFHK